jgi:hypothetical protein
VDRRTAFAAVSALVLTVTTGAVAVAANLGVLDQTDDAIGELQPVSSVTDVDDPTATPSPVETETVYVDEYVTDPGAPAPAGSAGVAPQAPPATGTIPLTAPGSGDDDDRYDSDEEWDDDRYEDEDHDDDDHDEDDHEYEGWDEDD